MGTWGVKLYQDDLAKDVKDYYVDQLKRDNTDDEVLNDLLERHNEDIEDDDEKSVFWFALSDTQWNLGRLSPLVKQKALELIDSKVDLDRWQDNQKYLAQREEVLHELRKKLTSSQPPKKKISKYRFYKCKWDIGDVYAYRLESELAKENQLAGRYFLLIKVDEDLWWPGHTIPIVWIKLTNNTSLPQSKNEIDNTDFVQIAYTRKVGKQLLSGYRSMLLSTSSRVIPKRLIKIGNFKDIIPPVNEYLPKDNIDIPCFRWSRIEDAIERLSFFKDKA